MPVPAVAAWWTGSVLLAAFGVGRGGQGIFRTYAAKRMVEEVVEEVEREQRYWKRDLRKLDRALEALNAEKLAAVTTELDALQFEWLRVGKELSIDPAVTPEEMPGFREFLATEGARHIDPSLLKTVGPAIKMTSSAALAEGIRLAIVGEASAIAVSATVKAAGLAGAKAGTGKLIADLSGISAQRAALAWLGGGPAAAGGGGILAGTAAISLMFAAPFAALGGELTARKGKLTKAEAEKHAARTRRELARSRQQREIMRACTRGAVRATEIIAVVRELLGLVIDQVREVADRIEAGEQLSDGDREVMFNSWRAASLLGRLLNDQLVSTDPSDRGAGAPLTAEGEAVSGAVAQLEQPLAKSSGATR